MKKVVLKVELPDAKTLKNAKLAISSLSGVQSLVVDMEEQKMTVIGKMDPVKITDKLKKVCYCKMEYVGAVKKEENKKDQHVVGFDFVKNLEIIRKTCPACPYQCHCQCYYYRPVTMTESPNGCVII